MDATPLETFVRDYVETAGGVWDEVEPEVYDILLPAADPSAAIDLQIRIAFDPEGSAFISACVSPIAARHCADPPTLCDGTR